MPNDSEGSLAGSPADHMSLLFEILRDYFIGAAVKHEAQRPLADRILKAGSGRFRVVLSTELINCVQLPKLLTTPFI